MLRCSFLHPSYRFLGLLFGQQGKNLEKMKCRKGQHKRTFHFCATVPVGLCLHPLCLHSTPEWVRPEEKGSNNTELATYIM
jgi:hypothetical protein